MLHAIARKAALAALLPLILAFTPAEIVSLRAGETLVRDIEVSEGGSVEATFWVNAQPAVARTVLWDHEKFPLFMPNARWATTLSRQGETAVVEQGGGQGPITIVITSERKRLADRIVWRSLKGDVKRNDGEWRFEASGPGTLLTYKVHVVPYQPVPQAMTRFLQKHALPNMVNAVRNRIEAEAKR